MASPGGPHRRLFDLWSLVYDAPPVQRLTYRPAQDEVLRRLRAEPRRRILDVGCGTGQLTARLRGAGIADTVIGCDFSRGMLGRAAARDSEVRWVQGDAGRLPLRDGSVGAIVSTEAFHWFPDPARALREFRRVLEPEGLLFVALVNPPFEVLSRLTHAGSRWVGEPFLWPTRRRMRRQVEDAGFHVRSQRRIFRIPAGLVLPTVLTEAVRAG